MYSVCLNQLMKFIFRDVYSVSFILHVFLGTFFALLIFSIPGFLSFLNIPESAYAITPTATLTPTPKSCPLRSQGDANCDGKVDISDFYIWRTAFIATVNHQGSGSST